MLHHPLTRVLLEALTSLALVALLPLVCGILLIASAFASLRRRSAPDPSRAASESPNHPRPTSALPPTPFRPPVSIVIPNWNGRDLLEKYLPSVIAASNFSLGDEIIVVDNASSDGSPGWVAEHHPQVRLLPLSENLGFGGGSNAGIHAASHRYIVLLNSDMRVEPDFLAPLLQPFADPTVFAVAAQILFSDPTKRREESGLTYAQWKHGHLELGHDVHSAIQQTFPCFYPGGGSSAFDGQKLKQLGGFDHLYRPFYFEDTDLGFEAWKRGWKVLYAPASVVYHEHRGTIGKKFSPSYIHRIVAKNRVLFHWKHIHHPGWLAAYCLSLLFQSVRAVLPGHPAPAIPPTAIATALLQLPELLRRRIQSLRSALYSDRAALSLHQPDIFYDRLAFKSATGPRLNVLFVSPYPIFPPHHGGAVLMAQTLRHLAELCDVHLVVLLEQESERAAHLAESSRFASMHLLVRPSSNPSNRLGLQPKAVREFASADLKHLIQRLIYEKSIHVLQLEYTHMAQYAGRYQHVLTALFEHDVYFQSVSRRLLTPGAGGKLKASLEYLRGLHFELAALSRMDYIQLCTNDNARYVASFLPALQPRMDASLRAGIEVATYPFVRRQRETATLLFIGNFRHSPNREGLLWLISQVMPLLLQRFPEIRLRVVGPNDHLLGLPQPTPPWLDLCGPVEDVRTDLTQCAIFVCPVLSGSGVRVKLLEAFASGIPVVSTSIGAEGLLYAADPVCLIADSPSEFASAILQLLSHPAEAEAITRAARSLVESDWDAKANTHKLVARYRELLCQKSDRFSSAQPRHPKIPEAGAAGI